MVSAVVSGDTVRTRQDLYFYNFIKSKINGRSLKVRNVCPHPLSNNVWLPPTDSRPRSRAAGTTWPGQLSEHDVNVWQIQSSVIQQRWWLVRRVFKEIRYRFDWQTPWTEFPMYDHVPSIRRYVGFVVYSRRIFGRHVHDDEVSRVHPWWLASSLAYSIFSSRTLFLHHVSLILLRGL